MIVMLLRAGSFKMTASRAEGIVPLVSNSPLTWWHFKLFGPYIGSDIIFRCPVGGPFRRVQRHGLPGLSKLLPDTQTMFPGRMGKERSVLPAAGCRAVQTRHSQCDSSFLRHGPFR